MIDIETLKAELAKTLPKYMVPTAYLQIEKMPMTLNGKIDLKSLPEATTIFRSGTTSKATNKVEDDFCKIFGSILQIEDVGADESFFDLGGTSLLATHVVIMAQKLGYKVNFADVFTNCTPRKLATLQKIDKAAVIDDEISNYDYSKLQNILDANFLAERLVLDAVANGLNAKIMRVGTLSARYSDGEFQINAGTLFFPLTQFYSKVMRYNPIPTF